MRVLAIIGLAGAMMATGSAGAAERKLDGAGIKAALTGARLYAFNGDVQVDYRSDGTMTGAHVRGGSDNGKWWVDGDNFCRQWNSWVGAKKGCSVVYQNGDKLRFESTETKQSVTGRLAR